MPRVYPPGFGQSLVDALRHWRPQPTLRQKKVLDLSKTDRELFSEMELGDKWADAQLPELYWYLRTLKTLKVPPSWEAEFEKIDEALKFHGPSQQASGAEQDL